MGACKRCDLVMEGGITSGVVYPAAVAELHRDYDFCRIGGTSAGAIAAAFTAAAQRHGDEGFRRLAETSAELCRPGRLVELFRPTPRTRPLLEVFLAALRGAHRADGRSSAFGGALGVLAVVPRSVPVPTLAGLAIGFAAVAALVWGVGGRHNLLFWLVAGIVALVAAAGAALLRLVWILLRDVPANNFGIARGHDRSGAGKAELTGWLHAQLARVAGLGPDQVLTFGQLGDAETPGVEALKVITTNLSEQRPYALPFEDGRFLFQKAEMEDYFPAEVVRALGERRIAEDLELPPGFYFLPDPAELPVVFAVRLSLSFPVLVSAVPLWSIRRFPPRAPDGQPRRLVADDLVRNWFSDGGICSNFPIHFFDKWLPGRPTFGISLTPWPQGRSHAPLVARPELSAAAAEPAGGPPAAPDEPEAEAVVLPRPNQPLASDWRDIRGLPAFLGRIVWTAKDYRDALQKALPGYRERVVQIRLGPDEGGLNLDMPAARIQNLVARGAAAGKVLRDHFDFETHRWVRLRTLVPPLAEQAAALRERLRGIDTAPPATPPAAPGRYVRDLAAAGGRVYRKGPEWCDRTEEFLETIGSASTLVEAGREVKDAPRPLTAIRVTPRI